MTTTDDAGRDFSSFNCPSALDVIAKQAFDDYASKYDTESDEWQDKGSNEYFIAGFKAALMMTNEIGDGIYGVRYIARANDEIQGWDIVDTQDWTSDVEDERENPVIMTVWDGSMVQRVLVWLNSSR